jgi:glucosamine--fructose-6-phosphate aminotransferase (isomerizing)
MSKHRENNTFEAGGASSRLHPVMLREIREEPERVETLIARETDSLERALRPVRESRPDLILVAGRGTSHHAAIYGHYLFQHFLGIPVSGAALSLFTLYPAPLRLEGSLVIGISQSGESTDVVKTLRTARKMGAFTLAVTNAPKSSLAGAADHTINLRARRERAVAATKTYTSSLVAMLMICRALGGGVQRSQIEQLPDAVRAAIGCEGTIVDLVPYYRYAPRCVCLARGFNYATVREVALKLMETCYLGSAGMSAADFLHGPIAFVEHGTPVAFFAAAGPTYGFMVDLAKRLERQHVDVLAFTNQSDILRHCTLGVRCPAEMEEALTPVPFSTLGQLFACHLALIRGLNPDAPRRLHKVTRTL